MAKEMSKDERLAEQAIEAMEGDNGCEFEHTTEQLDELRAAFARMMAAGAVVDAATIELIAAGDQDEADARFNACDGYHDVVRILNVIFNGETP